MATEVSPPRRELYEDSGGNPFYLEQLARDRRRAAPRPARRRRAAVPTSHRRSLAALGRELTRCRRRAAAAARGRRWRATRSSPRWRRPRPASRSRQALDAPRRAGRARLVRADGRPRRFRFRHPIVRRAVYETSRPAGGSARMSAGRRRSPRAAPADRARPPRRALRRQGDRARSRCSSRPATQAAARAPATAARWYGGALRLLADGAGRGARGAAAAPRGVARGDRPLRATSHAALVESLEPRARAMRRRARAADRGLRGRRAPARAVTSRPTSGSRAQLAERRAALAEAVDAPDRPRPRRLLPRARRTMHRWAEQRAAGATALGDRR